MRSELRTPSAFTIPELALIATAAFFLALRMPLVRQLRRVGIRVGIEQRNTAATFGRAGLRLRIAAWRRRIFRRDAGIAREARAFGIGAPDCVLVLAKLHQAGIVGSAITFALRGNVIARVVIQRRRRALQRRQIVEILRVVAAVLWMVIVVIPAVRHVRLTG